MSNKILTISIAAYNVADYIREGLDSLIASRYIDKLEIFVVDDGGNDATLEIAQEYHHRYPESIFPVHKENGGYGTTVNYSMEHATGKYFKLLDGDDWFDTEALDHLVEMLETVETDVIITPYKKGSHRDAMELVSFRDTFSDGEYKLKDLVIEQAIAMWSICYRTEILRISQLTLPARTLYSDQYFALIPFANVQTIQYLHYPVYQYRLGRDGQSVSRESRIKNIEMMVTICKNLVHFVKEQKGNANDAYLCYRTLVTYRNTIRTFMLLPVSREAIQGLKAFDETIKKELPELYRAVTDQSSHRKLGYFMRLCRLTNYQAFRLLPLLYPNGYPNF